MSDLIVLVGLIILVSNYIEMAVHIWLPLMMAFLVTNSVLSFPSKCLGGIELCQVLEIFLTYFLIYIFIIILFITKWHPLSEGGSLVESHMTITMAS